MSASVPVSNIMEQSWNGIQTSEYCVVSSHASHGSHAAPTSWNTLQKTSLNLSL